MTNDQPTTNANHDQPIDQPLQLQEELNENRQRPLSFYIVLGILIIVLLIGGIAGYFCYPFTQKIEGNWLSADETMELKSRGKMWELALPNYQQTKGLTLVYAGTWKAAGVNTYDGTQVKLFVRVNKKDFSKEEIAALKKKSELYTLSKQTDQELTLQYTKKGIQQIQSVSNVDTVVHMTLENIHWNKKKEKLYLNNSYFSNERIEFKYEK
jgi:hypothetical protein